jgi:transcriptional regulator with XRE-family HTH domain
MKSDLDKKVMKKLISIIDRISFLLSEKKMTQKDLATAMGVTEPYVSDILHYKKRNLGLETIVKLESAFGEDIIVNPDDFEENLVRNEPKLVALANIAGLTFFKPIITNRYPVNQQADSPFYRETTATAPIPATRSGFSAKAYPTQYEYSN